MRMKNMFKNIPLPRAIQGVTKFAACISLLGLTALPSTAQIIQHPSSANDEGTEILVGAAILSSPDYIGADDTDLRLLPYIEVRNFKGFDFLPLAVTYDVYNWETGTGIWDKDFRIGGRLAYEVGRDEDDADELAGLGDLDGSALLGAYAAGRYGPIGFRIEGGQDVISGSDGGQIDASIGSRFTFPNSGTLTAGYTVSWGTQDFNQSYFGITADQAANSQFNQFDIGNGIISNGFTALLAYPLSDQWEATAFASHQVYTDRIEASPIISADTGSDTQTTLLIGLSRKFRWNR